MKFLKPVVLLFIFLIVPSLFSQQAKPWPKRAFPSITADNVFWIGTPTGLYRYQYEDDAWAVFGVHNGLPSNDIQILTWDGEWLWAATPEGVAAGDVKLNKWLVYNSGNGLPSNRILAITADKDYVWAGTDRGAARYDKLIQEWELFTVQSGLPDSTVYDIAVDGDLVYFATGAGLAEYDVRFEKWRYFGKSNDIPSDTIRFIYPTAEYLWLFTDSGPARFNKKLHTAVSYSDPRLRYGAIRDLAVENDQMWLATESGIHIYDPSNSIWREFPQQNNLPDPSVTALCFNQDGRWFITDKGVSVFETGSQSWRRFDRTSGLSSDHYQATAVFGGRTFLVNDQTIDHYRPQENQWYAYPLADLNASSSGKTRFSLNREKGSYVQFGDDVRFSLSGTRFRQVNNGNHEYQPSNASGQWTSSGYSRMDLKAQLTLPKGRTLNGFYDNTDISQTLYGVKYRGNDADILQEAAWGDIRVEQGKNELLPALGVFGGSARLEYGGKTERYKRSLLSARGVSGERTTGQETEFFKGNLKTTAAEILDTYYIRNSAFRIGDAGASFPVDAGSESVFIDDGDPSTNTANTLIQTSFAGITADFDRLAPTIGYKLDSEKGVLQLLSPAVQTATIIVLGSSQGVPFERILKTAGNWENLLVNRYFVGGMEILPHSFKLEFVDVSGSSRSLSEFGLDRNGDGRVDPEFIDYREGLLVFPEERPFPATTYDPVSPVPNVRMRASFQSEIPSFALKHDNLLRGSEILKVDGETLVPGNDYVLDYTSGTLLILKEGVIAEDSEIEIRYEFYRDTRETFRSAGIGFGPSDNVLMEVNAFGFDSKVSEGPLQSTRGVDFFGEFKGRAGAMDLKFTPQMAWNETESDSRGMHVNFRTDASTQKMRLFAQYETIDPGYKTLFERRFQLGELGQKAEAGGMFYPLACLDIGGGWIRQSSHSSIMGINTEEDWNGKILFNKPSYPAASLSIRKQTLDTPGSDTDKRTLKGEFEYKVPEPVLRKLAIRSLRLTGVWRRSWEGAFPRSASTSVTPSRKIFDNRYFRMDFSPADRIQIDAYYRSGQNRSAESFNGLFNDPYDETRKIFVTTTVDRFEGLNGYLLYQGESSRYRSSPNVAAGDWSLDRTMLAMLRLYPGRWIPLLSPFTFEVDFQPSFRGAMRNVERDPSFLNRYWELPDGPEATYIEKNNTVLFRNEWRPSGGLTMYLDFEKGEGLSRNWGSNLKTTRDRIYQRTEFRPTLFSLITFQYQRIRDEKQGYSVFVTDNPVFWLETRWSEQLQTKCNISLWRESRKYGKIDERLSTFSPLVGMTYRIIRPGFRLEIRDDVSASFYRNRKPLSNLEFNSYSNSLAFEYYPASVLIFKLRGTASYRDRLDADEDLWNLAFEFRLTAQF